MGPDTEQDQGPPTLDDVERRIVGCLIEKERATPQNYPLTLNALRLACNQTTNRDPVTDYDERTLETGLASLRQRNLTRIVYSTSNRAAKYRHVLGEAWKLDDEELAVLAVLMLRGPQTVGEIKGRTERLASFGDLAAVQAVLDRLAERPLGALVVRHERRPGQKDARWAHLLGGDVDEGVDEEGAAFDGPAAGDGGEPAWTGAAHTGATAPPAGDAELEAVKAQVSQLQDELSALRADFEAFRAEFR